MPPASDHEIKKLSQRVTDLEDEAGRNAERFDEIKDLLKDLTVAVSGDAKNDILGLVGRMRLIDGQILELQKNQTIMQMEWAATKNQLKGAGRVWSVVWAFIGAGGLAIIWKAFQLFTS